MYRRHLNTVEPVNTSGVHFLLAFNITNGTLYIFVFDLSYRNVNQTFFGGLNPLNNLVIPYFTFIL